LTVLTFTLSLSEPIGRSLLSFVRELFSGSVLGMEERMPKPVCCEIPSDFPTPTAPLRTPGLYRDQYHLLDNELQMIIVKKLKLIQVCLEPKFKATALEAETLISKFPLHLILFFI